MFNIFKKGNEVNIFAGSKGFRKDNPAIRIVVLFVTDKSVMYKREDYSKEILVGIGEFSNDYKLETPQLYQYTYLKNPDRNAALAQPIVIYGSNALEPLFKKDGRLLLKQEALGDCPVSVLDNFDKHWVPQLTRNNQNNNGY